MNAVINAQIHAIETKIEYPGLPGLSKIRMESIRKNAKTKKFVINPNAIA
jgi:hypothetical protein